MDTYTQASYARPKTFYPRDNQFPHGFQMALRQGDILVLMTDIRDEDGFPCGNPEPLALIHIDSIDHNPVMWRVSTDKGVSLKGSTEYKCLHRVLRMKSDGKVVTKLWGDCTIFRMEIMTGYRVHYLNYVKEKYPEVHAQLHLS